MPTCSDIALDEELSALVSVITKPSNSKFDAPLEEEAELCPSVVTTTVCSASCRPAALQLNPHAGLCKFLKPLTSIGVDLSTATE